MKSYKTALAALWATSFVGACGSNEGLFSSKPAPDEFAVYSRAPLAMPPDFAIRPPEPGAMRSQEVAPRNKAEEALLGGIASPRAQKSAGGDTPGLNALLKNTGSLNADPKIRETIRGETAEKPEIAPGLAERMLSFTKSARSRQEEKGIVIDPESEDKRLKAMQVEGRGISSGAPPPKPAPAAKAPGDQDPQAPKITRDSAPKEKGFWSWLF